MDNNPINEQNSLDNRAKQFRELVGLKATYQKAVSSKFWREINGSSKTTRTHKFFTEEDDRIILEQFNAHPENSDPENAKEVAKKLGRTYNSTYIRWTRYLRDKRNINNSNNLGSITKIKINENDEVEF